MGTSRRYFFTMAALIFFAAISIPRWSGASEYRFGYGLKPAQTWLAKKSGTLKFTAAGRRVQQPSKRVVEYRVSGSNHADAFTLTARILEQFKNNRRIPTFDGVIFQGVLSTKGALTRYSFSGGSPKFQALIAVACPAMEYEIFWMPEFPARPLGIGDHFENIWRLNMPATAGGGSGVEGQVRRVYLLKGIKDRMAQFSSKDHAFMSSRGVGADAAGTEMSLFDMVKGMWTRFNIRVKGLARGPGLGGGVNYYEDIRIEVELR